MAGSAKDAQAYFEKVATDWDTRIRVYDWDYAGFRECDTPESPLSENTSSRYLGE
jgi:hypothetical protein